MAEKKDKTIVNVLGLQRSGTTMLHLMLGSGPDAIACGEIGGWFRVARHRSQAEPPERFSPLQNVSPDQFHLAALEHFGVDFIIDSTKAFEWTLDVNRWAEQQELRVFNILIWKEPTDQVYSFWKRGGSEKSLWRYNWYHRRLMRAGIDFFTVSYSELVDNPSAKLQEICRAIGMSYFEGKERFWEESHAFAGSSQGVRNQVQRGNSRIQKEPKPPEFEPVATEVKRKIRQNPKLRETLSFLRVNEISHLAPFPLASHEYDPSLASRLEHYFWKYTKNTWLRLRWNLLEPWMGSRIRKFRRFLSSSPSSSHVKSFDPDASR